MSDAGTQGCFGEYDHVQRSSSHHHDGPWHCYSDQSDLLQSLPDAGDFYYHESSSIVPDTDRRSDFRKFQDSFTGIPSINYIQRRRCVLLEEDVTGIVPEGELTPYTFCSNSSSPCQYSSPPSLGDRITDFSASAPPAHFSSTTTAVGGRRSESSEEDHEGSQLFFGCIDSADLSGNNVKSSIFLNSSIIQDSSYA